MSFFDRDLNVKDHGAHICSAKSDSVSSLHFDKRVKFRRYSSQFTLANEILVAIDRREEYRRLENIIIIEVDLSTGFCNIRSTTKSTYSHEVRLNEMVNINPWVKKMTTYDTFLDKSALESIRDEAMEPNKLYLLTHKHKHQTTENVVGSLLEDKSPEEKKLKTTAAQFNPSELYKKTVDKPVCPTDYDRDVNVYLKNKNVLRNELIIRTGDFPHYTPHEDQYSSTLNIDLTTYELPQFTGNEDINLMSIQNNIIWKSNTNENDITELGVVESDKVTKEYFEDVIEPAAETKEGKSNEVEEIPFAEESEIEDANVDNKRVEISKSLQYYLPVFDDNQICVVEKEIDKISDISRRTVTTDESESLDITTTDKNEYFDKEDIESLNVEDFDELICEENLRSPTTNPRENYAFFTEEEPQERYIISFDKSYDDFVDPNDIICQENLVMQVDAEEDVENTVIDDIEFLESENYTVESSASIVINNASDDEDTSSFSKDESFNFKNILAKFEAMDSNSICFANPMKKPDEKPYISLYSDRKEKFFKSDPNTTVQYFKTSIDDFKIPYNDRTSSPSSNEETDTSKRNEISPISSESSMIVKDVSSDDAYKFPKNHPNYKYETLEEESEDETENLVSQEFNFQISNPFSTTEEIGGQEENSSSSEDLSVYSSSTNITVNELILNDLEKTPIDSTPGNFENFLLQREKSKLSLDSKNELDKDVKLTDKVPNDIKTAHSINESKKEEHIENTQESSYTADTSLSSSTSSYSEPIKPILRQGESIEDIEKYLPLANNDQNNLKRSSGFDSQLNVLYNQEGDGKNLLYGKMSNRRSFSTSSDDNLSIRGESKKPPNDAKNVLNSEINKENKVSKNLSSEKFHILSNTDTSTEDIFHVVDERKENSYIFDNYNSKKAPETVNAHSTTNSDKSDSNIERLSKPDLRLSGVSDGSKMESSKINQKPEQNLFRDDKKIVINSSTDTSSNNSLSNSHKQSIPKDGSNFRNQKSIDREEKHTSLDPSKKQTSSKKYTTYKNSKSTPDKTEEKNSEYDFGSLKSKSIDREEKFQKSPISKHKKSLPIQGENKSDSSSDEDTYSSTTISTSDDELIDDGIKIPRQDSINQQKQIIDPSPNIKYRPIPITKRYEKDSPSHHDGSTSSSLSTSNNKLNNINEHEKLDKKSTISKEEKEPKYSDPKNCQPFSARQDTSIDIGSESDTSISDTSDEEINPKNESPYNPQKSIDREEKLKLDPSSTYKIKSIPKTNGRQSSSDSDSNASTSTTGENEIPKKDKSDSFEENYTKKSISKKEKNSIDREEKFTKFLSGNITKTTPIDKNHNLSRDDSDTHSDSGTSISTSNEESEDNIGEKYIITSDKVNKENQIPNSINNNKDLPHDPKVSRTPLSKELSVPEMQGTKYNSDKAVPKMYSIDRREKFTNPENSNYKTTKQKPFYGEKNDYPLPSPLEPNKANESDSESSSGNSESKSISKDDSKKEKSVSISGSDLILETSESEDLEDDKNEHKVKKMNFEFQGKNDKPVLRIDHQEKFSNFSNQDHKISSQKSQDQTKMKSDSTDEDISISLNSSLKDNLEPEYIVQNKYSDKLLHVENPVSDIFELSFKGTNSFSKDDNNLSSTSDEEKMKKKRNYLKCDNRKENISRSYQTLPTDRITKIIPIKEKSKSLEKPLNEIGSIPISHSMPGSMGSIVESRYHECTETWSRQSPISSEIYSKNLSKSTYDNVNKSKLYKKPPKVPYVDNNHISSVQSIERFLRKPIYPPLTTRPRPVPSYLSPVNVFPYVPYENEFDSTDSIVNDYSVDIDVEEFSTKYKSLPEFINSLSTSSLPKAPILNKSNLKKPERKKKLQAESINLNYGAKEIKKKKSNQQAPRKASITSVTTDSSYLERPILDEKPMNSHQASSDSLSSLSNVSSIKQNQKEIINKTKKSNSESSNTRDSNHTISSISSSSESDTQIDSQSFKKIPNSTALGKPPMHNIKAKLLNENVKRDIPKTSNSLPRKRIPSTSESSEMSTSSEDESSKIYHF